MSDEEAYAVLLRRYPQDMARLKASRQMGLMILNPKNKKWKRSSNSKEDYVKMLKDRLNEEADDNAAIVRDERQEVCPFYELVYI